MAALLINGQIAGRLTPIHAAVTKIDEQTNGVLDQRIKIATTPDAMRDSLVDHATDSTSSAAGLRRHGHVASRRDRRRMPEQV